MSWFRFDFIVRILSLRDIVSPISLIRPVNILFLSLRYNFENYIFLR